jgi:8-oxo-dGTP pyrophosphatase MutT (NUDIX family)
MAVVLTPDGRRVLLLRRQFLFLWDLPGGGIDRGEEPPAAAVRETREETGYLIEIEREVGRYRHPSVYGRGDQLTHVFRARVTGGAPRSCGWETAALRWRAVDDLPRGLEPLQRLMIGDALADSTGAVARRVDFPAWKLYPARLAFMALRAAQTLLRGHR